VLDAGRDSRTIPAGLERAVRRRDRRCRFPGCDVPAELAQVHHLTEWDNGGTHRLDNLLILCSFHHLIAVHAWGWMITAHPDGTITATSPQGRTLHEPPGRCNDPPRAA
jgi:predicted restriction endonuclease